MSCAIVCITVLLAICVHIIAGIEMHSQESRHFSTLEDWQSQRHTQNALQLANNGQCEYLKEVGITCKMG